MVILCDFDDTTAEQNVAIMLLERFSPDSPDGSDGGWWFLQQQFRDRIISLLEYQETAFSRTVESWDAQVDFVRGHASLRSGFRELVDFCGQLGLGLAIVSHGLDFYIAALLKAQGLAHLPYYAVETARANGQPAFRYPFSNSDCEWWPGNCKCRVLEAYRARGHQVLYAGDGFTDTCPARKADFVFARGDLLGFCQREDIPHRELTDFHQVIDYLKTLGTDDAIPAPAERLRFD